MSAESRMHLLFDRDWRFNQSEVIDGQMVSLDDTAWRTLDLPHDWSIEGEFDQNAPCGGGGGYLPGGVGWYRKHFHLTKTDNGKRFTIQFDGVYKNCDVWINGRHLGFHPYGYTSFYYDLTPYLLFDEQENVLAVRVDNSTQPDARWYSGSGIYRHVWLTSTDTLHIGHWGTFVRTPKVTSDLARVEVLTKVHNDSDVIRHCELVSSVIDADGECVGSVSKLKPLLPGQKFTFTQQINVISPHLWSDKDPYLYNVRNEIKEGGKSVDAYETTLGIRDIEFDADRGFLLNGEQVKINGVCIHHDGGCVGAAVPERVWERRLQTLKEMGCNGIRSSHYPPAPEFLDLCDELGFLVMDENFDEWRMGKFDYGYHSDFDAWAVPDTISMVRRDRNHPSIVIWSAGNEIPEQGVPEGVAILQQLVDTIHAEDPTRPVTSACDNIEAYLPTTDAFLEALDVVGYNYVDRWEEKRELYYSMDRERHPQRKMIGTENAAIHGARGDYALTSQDRWHRLYHRSMVRVEQLWKYTRVHDYVAGDYMWTGIDYLGETRWPSKNASCGQIDTCGFVKDGFYFYQSQWTDDPMVHIFPHWTWPGCEGTVIPVLAYTNCDSVELFVNGRSFGEQVIAFPRTGMDRSKGWGEQDWSSFVTPDTADLHLRWTVPYEAGELKAVGKRNGDVVCTQVLKTAGVPASIQMIADRESINADGMDVVHLTVLVLDEQGLPVPNADNLIEFEVTGPGKIIGVDNGNPISHEPFKAQHRKLFNGMCLAVVQSTYEAGTIHVTAKSVGLADAHVSLVTLPESE